MGLAVILSSDFESRFPQAGRADFGMCFIVGTLSLGCASFESADPVELMLFDVTVAAVDDCAGCELGVDVDEVKAEACNEG